MVQFEIRLVDAQGTVAPDADTDVRVTAAGGELLGLDNGDPADHTLSGSPVRKTYRGLAYGVARAPRLPGELTLTFAAEGLAPVTCTVRCVP